jgi:hypothetical protein
VSEALAPPLLVGSLVLCIAGLAKLRAPATAAAALGLGRVGPYSIRVLAVGEVALGAACVIHPTRALAVALAAAYAVFAAVAVVLKRRRAACGCFGDNDLPVSPAHVIASELLGTVAVAAAVASPRGLAWLAHQPPPNMVALAVGIAGAVYATVLVYTTAPLAWGAWRPE